MTQIGFGIVGPGYIAGVIAEALDEASNARLSAVSSRRIENARKFTEGRPGVAAIEGFENLLARPDVDAVYVATPTAAKEEIALAAIAAGKHVLVDKPFRDRASVLRMTEAAATAGLVFMDATHFVHHPRTAAFQAAIPGKIGSPRSLHTAFYFPFSDRANIRFDPKQEPMTALGDMAWYSMRAVVEYLRPEGAVTKAVVVPEHDAETNAIVRASGLIAFEDGRVSTFDVGYTAGTIVMDLQLLGTTGVLQMDDFVLDWESSSVFKASGDKVGYVHRTGMATRKDLSFVPTPPRIAQEAAMIEDFATLVASGDARERAAHAEATAKTQGYLDSLWASMG
ncbi:Gfo/Idh/MocA family protein [Paludisphaera soli]|uniref:Gfo/Idh/MocA family protein n=1 Tax=Paludisphaera soli TaxID=2712865 RepID=UPI0013E9C23D|nr:Gfo/Idh/MocA family oxidoreductase [Paludisphaera soli]